MLKKWENLRKFGAKRTEKYHLEYTQYPLQEIQLQDPICTKLSLGKKENQILMLKETS